MSKVVMQLKKMEDFTQQTALLSLSKFMQDSDFKAVNLSTQNLNLIKNGRDDHNMKKYVVSIGDGLYQIVAYAVLGRGVTVAVDYFQLSRVRRYAEEYEMKLLDQFTPDLAFDFFKEWWKNINPNFTPSSLNRIHNGIFDSNMVKYVVSQGFMLYQIAAIKSKPDANFVSVVSTASSI